MASYVRKISVVLRTHKGKGKEEYLYSGFLAKVVHSKRSGMDHTVLPANNTIAAHYSFIDPGRMKG